MEEFYVYVEHLEMVLPESCSCYLFKPILGGDGRGHIFLLQHCAGTSHLRLSKIVAQKISCFIQTCIANQRKKTHVYSYSKLQ